MQGAGCKQQRMVLCLALHSGFYAVDVRNPADAAVGCTVEIKSTVLIWSTSDTFAECITGRGLAIDVKPSKGFRQCLRAAQSGQGAQASKIQSVCIWVERLRLNIPPLTRVLTTVTCKQEPPSFWGSTLGENSKASTWHTHFY